MSYIIRPMQDRDIPQAIDIDREAFTSQWPHPTYASFKQELRNRLARYIVVAKDNEPEPEAAKQNTDNESFWQRLLQLKHLSTMTASSAKRYLDLQKSMSSVLPVSG